MVTRPRATNRPIKEDNAENEKQILNKHFLHKWKTHPEFVLSRAGYSVLPRANPELYSALHLGCNATNLLKKLLTFKLFSSRSKETACFYKELGLNMNILNVYGYASDKTRPHAQYLRRK
jgi:hypothetical protein